ncbi:hypothetical protein [Streptomyces sp. TLI_185]|uniref:hypothetical protein n=1 Tax=Streptomyces sp. TLI_185 TaxID=2485151 RepID=UPI000F517035|nr:hypothetical protein [Streptomyces sp. TLI_185]RPF35581.1 hypothetical protein EDD92_5600 [Streptomyces sp. TLI_185]
MSQEEASGAAAPDSETEQDGEQKKQEEAAESQEQKRQEAWGARQALITHGPSFVQPLAAQSATRIARDQIGVSGGTFHGNVNFFGGPARQAEQLSGEIPRENIQKLSGVFCGCPSFDEALHRLRTEKVVILSGGRDTGRSSAALMLLDRLGMRHIRSLEPPDSVSALPEQLDGAAGYLLPNLATSRSRPLRDTHLFQLRERLNKLGGHLVITVEPSATLDDVPCIPWEPPSPEDMLYSHVTPRTGEDSWAGLVALAPVQEFLARPQQPREIEEFGQRLIAFHRGETDEAKLAEYGATAVETQVAGRLTDEKRPLRDKAFLISLAVFDKAPYAVAAELGDDLYVRLQKTADPRQSPVIPVFGNSRESRLQLAGAKGYVDTEVTEWGTVVGQYFAAFRDERTAPVLLHEVWVRHPSARPALAEWIRALADDGRPLVRTRAASATAQLAAVDLSSTMAHLIEPWADDDYFGSWLTAANALTMAQLLSVPHVFRILHDWCTGEIESRRWTAVRAYGLLGPVNHEETLSALLDAIRRPAPDDRDQDDEDDDSSQREEARQFAEALELLLLAVRKPVLSALVDRVEKRHLDNTGRAVRAHALLAFLEACKQSKGEDSDRPPVLDWYAQATADDDKATARELAVFWQALLADRAHNSQALDVLRGWVRRADGDPVSEAALTSLLPALATTPVNHRRVSHMLGTVRDFEGTLTPAAARLLRHLDPV